MQEDGGLRHLGLLQVFRRAGEHQVRDAETDDLVGFLKHGAALFVANQLMKAGMLVFGCFVSSNSIL